MGCWNRYYSTTRKVLKRKSSNSIDAKGVGRLPYLWLPALGHQSKGRVVGLMTCAQQVSLQGRVEFISCT